MKVCVDASLNSLVQAFVSVHMLIQHVLRPILY